MRLPWQAAPQATWLLTKRRRDEDSGDYYFTYSAVHTRTYIHTTSNHRSTCMYPDGVPMVPPAPRLFHGQKDSCPDGGKPRLRLLVTAREPAPVGRPSRRQSLPAEQSSASVHSPVWQGSSRALRRCRTSNGHSERPQRPRHDTGWVRATRGRRGRRGQPAGRRR